MAPDGDRELFTQTIDVGVDHPATVEPRVTPAPERPHLELAVQPFDGDGQDAVALVCLLLDLDGALLAADRDRVAHHRTPCWPGGQPSMKLLSRFERDGWRS